MQTSIYAKFLGKSLPLEQAKLAMTDSWRGLGAFTVADLPNGFYYIRCESQEMQCRLLWDGPWTVAGRILQLAPWSESFQPAFEKLSIAVVWIQIYHLPIELWEGDILETVASQFGKLLKVDEHTLDRTRAKFARVCVELDLSKPLQQGTWVKYGEFSVFVLVLYEKLPVFCFKCGLVGHGEANCPTHSNRPQNEPHVPSGGSPELVREDIGMQVDDADDGLDGIAVDVPSFLPPEDDSKFGPWLKPSGRRSSNRGRATGRGGGRGGGSRASGNRNPNPNHTVGDDEQIVDKCPPSLHNDLHVASSSHAIASRGGHSVRGGLSRHFSKALVPSTRNPEGIGTIKPYYLANVSPPPERMPPILSSDPLDLDIQSDTAPSSSIPQNLGSLDKGPLISPPPKLLISNSEPLLITSNQNLDPNNDPISSDRHLGIVGKVVEAITHLENNEEEMEELSSDDSASPLEPDDDMTLLHYQKDIKLEAIARREPSKNATKKKKGRNSLLP